MIEENIQPTEKKQELIEFIGIYTGREYRRDYTTKAGKTGKVYGLKVKESPEAQFAKGFTAYSSTKGIDTISEGDWVKLGFVMETFTRQNGEPGTSHKVLWIGKTDNRPIPGQPAAPSSSQQQQLLATQSISQMDGFTVFTAKYLERAKTDADMRHGTRMMGAWLLFKHRQTYWELFCRCQKSLGLPIPKR